MKKKVVVIGAGPAGLTVANELANTNMYDILVIEKDLQVGGISKTVVYNENRMDIGGHRFFTKDEKIKEYWQEILPLQGAPSLDELKLNKIREYNEGSADPQKEDDVFLLRRRVSRILYRGKFYDYPISLKFKTFKNLGFVTTIKAGLSYMHALVHKRKENSLEDFYINRFGKVLYECFFKDYTTKVWGREPSQISSDWGKQRVKGLSIKEILKNALNIGKSKETSLIEEFWYPKYGPGQMYEKLEKILLEKGVKIQKETEVTKINLKNDKIVSVEVVHDKNSRKINADYVISSMPIKELINSIDTPVQNDIAKIAGGLPYRDFITVGLLVSKLELKNNTNIKTIGNIVPDCWIYVQEKNVKIGRIQVFNNWSPYMVKDIENTVWIGLEYFVSEEDALWNMNEKDFIEFATQELESINVIKKENVVDAHVEKVKKAYPAYFDTYEQIDTLRQYLNKIDNLYCIGRNGQHRYNNMDHSMLSAIECANNIINNVKDKSNIWSVNTEKEYHECTKK